MSEQLDYHMSDTDLCSVCLMIKGIGNHAQDLRYHINQDLTISEILVVSHAGNAKSRRVLGKRNCPEQAELWKEPSSGYKGYRFNLQMQSSAGSLVLNHEVYFYHIAHTAFFRVLVVILGPSQD